jgi:hypothetical protein
MAVAPLHACLALGGIRAINRAAQDAKKYQVYPHNIPCLAD